MSSYEFNLTPVERMGIRWNNLAGLYCRIDRIISGKNIEVKLINDTRAPIAYTDINSSIVNLNTVLLVPPTSAENISNITAVNYHELCHVLYDCPALRKNMPDSHSRVFNILEDSRIERRFVFEYNIAAEYFIKMVMQYIIVINSDSDYKAMHVLVHGRNYLPYSWRSKVRSDVEDHVFRDAVESIIDEYVRLDLSPNCKNKDIKRAEKLIDDLYNLLDKDDIDCPTGCVVAMGASVSAQVPDHSKSDEQKILEDVNVITLSESKGVQSAIGSGCDVTADPIRIMGTCIDTVPADYVALARSMSREFERIYSDKESGWERRTATGKVNPIRVAQGCDSSEVFDLWEDDNTEDTAIEVVVLIDHSTSMRGNRIATASKTVWALKHAIEKTGGLVTVYAYNTFNTLVYSSKERVNNNNYKLISASGNTNPSSSLMLAHQLLALSSRTNKLLIIVSDGAWCYCHNIDGTLKDHGGFNSPSCSSTVSDKSIARIGMGATTALYLINDVPIVGNNFGHGCQVAEVINKTSDLLPAVKAVVAQTMRRGAYGA